MPSCVGSPWSGGAPGRCAEPLARPSLQFSADVCDVSLGERFAGLTPTEYRLLETFLAAEGETLTKAFLYQHVLHRGHTQHDRSLDMHVITCGASCNASVTPVTSCIPSGARVTS